MANNRKAACRTQSAGARTTILIAAGAMLAVGWSARADAHHSRAEFNTREPIELEGEVVRVIWRNPHVGLEIRVDGADGASEHWTMDAGDLIGTVRRGVPDNMMLEPGDPVRVAGFRSSTRSGRMMVTNVLPPNGIEVILVGNEARWSERTVGGNAWIVDESAQPEREPNGIFRVWTLQSTARPPFVDDPPLTAAARAALDAWNPLDDPALQCVSIGMPRAITRTGPHPIEFVAQPNGDIHVLMEYFDLVRVIHMDENAAARAASAAPSALGYSVGRWDNGELVVTTTRVNWPYFDIRDLDFVPQSEAVEIVERFRLSPDATELTMDITVTDPAAFTAPLVANDYSVWRYRPGVRVEPYNCTLD
jgi:hypothetical protein